MKHDHSQPKMNLPARRIRHDGWTADRQEAFLKAYVACGTIIAACRAVGMSRQSLRDLCAHPSAIAFRMAFDAARDCAMALVEDGAVERAINGVRRPVFYHGEKVGEYREYDERLTMFLLRCRRRYRYGSQLDHLPPPPPPLEPPGCEFDEPDEDEAMGRLDCNLDDLTDYGDPPDLSVFSRPETIDKFDNFVGDDDATGERQPDQARHGDCDDSGAPLEPGE
jgi:hypothetical protein